TVTNSIVLQIARAYTPAPIARHQRSSTQLTSLLINNAGALRGFSGAGSGSRVYLIRVIRAPHRSCSREQHGTARLL
ncbi:hypothetical protein, partial [Mycobacterium pseudoshottsii]|uniref:hypothetical protein n=1 Tax=Mycobacterium pseudoshottsii TaxID=265949 RepID=UPI003FD72913